MECNEQEKKIIEKAKFYFLEKLKAHVLIVPKPKFKNGLFVSELILSDNGSHFWFIENNSSIPMRLFLSEIYDIEDYLEEEK